jgi:Gamma-glutamyl cyclotransferase, AIG2-like
MDSSRLQYDRDDIAEKIDPKDLDFDARPSQSCPSPGAIAHLKGDPSDWIPPQVDDDIEYELDRPAMAAKLMNNIKSQTVNTPFDVSADTSLLCYGSLMDPEVLQAVLNLPEIPTMRDGWVEGYTMKKWGIYPTTVPQKGSKIYGKVWRIVLPPYMDRLAEYETEAYTPEICEIELEDGGRITDGRIFKWSGALESNHLHDGEFDLGWYQAYLKPGIIRPWKEQKRKEEEI